jgi:hypothetical protein
MPARPHAAPPLQYLPGQDGYTKRDATFGPDLLNDPTGRLLAQLAAPAAQYLPPYAGAEIPTHLLYDQAADAWARLYQSSAGSWKVRQAGPVDLCDDIEHAWTEAGQPSHDQLTIAATPDSQTATLTTQTVRGPGHCRGRDKSGQDRGSQHRLHPGPRDVVTGQVEPGVHVEPEPAVGVDVGPEQR